MVRFKVVDCPICGKPIPEKFLSRHMDRAHEVDEEAIRKSARKDGYYGWQEFQDEQMAP